MTRDIAESGSQQTHGGSEWFHFFP